MQPPRFASFLTGSLREPAAFLFCVFATSPTCFTGAEVRLRRLPPPVAFGGVSSDRVSAHVMSSARVLKSAWSSGVTSGSHHDIHITTRKRPFGPPTLKSYQEWPAGASLDKDSPRHSGWSWSHHLRTELPKFGRLMAGHLAMFCLAFSCHQVSSSGALTQDTIYFACKR